MPHTCAACMQVWHEKWGEDYAKGGDACLKWTDRWSETMLDGGAQRAQGDKWREEFSGGTGSKNGETWFVDESGHRCAAPFKPLCAECSRLSLLHDE